MDGSRRHLRNSDGDVGVFYFYEHVTAFCHVAVVPSKTTEVYMHAVDGLVLHIKAIAPDVKIRRLSGDFDTTWAVQGNPESMLPAGLRAYSLERKISIVPMPPHLPAANLAEPHIGRVNALACASAFTNGLDIVHVWADAIRGGAYLRVVSAR